MTIAEAIAEGAAVLEIGGVPEVRRDADVLLRAAISRDRAFVIAHPEYTLRQDELARYREFIERRAQREPLQYIIGHTEFYGLEFRVTRDVLIPRPETELIVDKAIALLKDERAPRFCEIGIGSGCIAVSILVNVSLAAAVGCDTSEKALAIANENAAAHGVAERLKLSISDVFDAIEPHQFDLIAANPPYVPRIDLESLQAEVSKFEPRMALTDGADGLTIIRRIVHDAPDFIRPNGTLLMEIGFNQAAEVEKMFDSSRWANVEIEPDLQGIPRMVNASRK